MRLNIYKDYESLSHHAAEAILTIVKSNPAAVLCLATGDTPRLAYELMVKKAIAEKLDLTGCTFIGLDEWVGIPPQSEGSCKFFLETLILNPLNIAGTQVHLFDGMSADLPGECSRMNTIVAEKGIDLMIAGVGINGHVGFNEPFIFPGHHAHIAELDDTTVSVGQKYFTRSTPLKLGITLGLTQVLKSKKLIMMANGRKKAEVMQKALEEEMNNSMPAGIIRTHADGLVMIDEQAASLLTLQMLSSKFAVRHI